MPAERATQAAQVLLRLHYRELAGRGRAELPGAPPRPQRHGRSVVTTRFPRSRAAANGPAWTRTNLLVGVFSR
jgi:hypothetical protein